MSVIPHLEAVRAHLMGARDVALAAAVDATYQLSHGRFTPLTEANATLARVEDLLHLTDRLLSSHGVKNVPPA